MRVTLINIQPHLRTTNNYLRYKMVCKDGFSVSVNAGNAFYSTPNVDDAGFYRKVELADPSALDPRIQVYAHNLSDPLRSYYPNVPIDVVVDLLNAHGGLIEIDEGLYSQGLM